MMRCWPGIVLFALCVSAPAAAQYPPPPAWGVAPGPPAPAYPPPHPEWRLAVGTEAAFGISPGSFYNHLAGGRIDRRFAEETALGLYLGYVNLKGPEGRVHNALIWVQLDHRVEIGGGLQLPLRFAPGYLPNNGPVLRAATGLAWDVAEDVEIVLDLLAPMVWTTHDQPVLSLNLAAELGFSF